MVKSINENGTSLLNPQQAKALLTPITRRSVLRGLSATAAGLIAAPLSSALAAGGSGSGYAKRFILAGLFNGVSKPHWYPTNADGITEAKAGNIPLLGRTLDKAGLSKYKHLILQVKGVHHSYISDPRFRASFQHLDGLTIWHTGDSYFGGKRGEPNMYQRCLSPSIDQIVASHLSNGAPIESIQWATNGHYGPPVKNTSAFKLDPVTGVTKSLPPIDEPIFLYQKLAAKIGGNASGNNKAAIMAFNQEDINLMKRRFSSGSDIGQMLENHYEIIGRLLDGYSQSVGSCNSLVAPPTNNLSIGKKIELNTDLTALALICGLTNVANIMLFPQGANTPATYAASNDEELANLKKNASHGLHGWSHEKTHVYSDLQSFHLRHLTRLCDKLAAYTENSGSMLDNTMMYVGSDIGDTSHNLTNIPSLIIGGCGGYFGKMGRMVVVSETPEKTRTSSNPQFSTSRVLLSLAHACGLEQLTSIGEPDYCPSPLTSLIST